MRYCCRNRRYWRRRSEYIQHFYHIWFYLAAAGIPVAKHGNRSVSSKCGAADLIEALGAKLELNGEQNEAVLNKANMCFMFAPVYHQA